MVHTYPLQVWIWTSWSSLRLKEATAKTLFNRKSLSSGEDTRRISQQEYIASMDGGNQFQRDPGDKNNTHHAWDFSHFSEALANALHSSRKCSNLCHLRNVCVYIYTSNIVRKKEEMLYLKYRKKKKKRCSSGKKDAHTRGIWVYTIFFRVCKPRFKKGTQRARSSSFTSKITGIKGIVGQEEQHNISTVKRLYFLLRGFSSVCDPTFYSLWFLKSTL
jgi:hypothetical protein